MAIRATRHAQISQSVMQTVMLFFFLVLEGNTAEIAAGELPRPWTMTLAWARLRMKLPMISGRLSWG